MGLPGDLVLLDAGYGHDAKLRTGITELEKVYVAGIQPQTLVWAPGTRHRGAPKKGRRDAPNAASVKEVALGLHSKAWAHDRLARRHEPTAVLAICPGACACCIQARTSGQAGEGVAVDRVAGGRR